MSIDNSITEQKLAGALTAETTELIPYLPYLLQDLWELGSSPADMIRLVKENVETSSETNVIDLGCGKGAVSVSLCRELGVRAKGIDLLPEFIEVAREKAKEFGVAHLCEFAVQDINVSVSSLSGYDIAVLGAVGDVLGNPAETLGKLKKVVRSNGYILIDEAFLEGEQKDVRYQNYEYLTKAQWKDIFQEAGVELVAELTYQDSPEADETNDYNNRMIRRRAEELSERYPDKRRMFEGYVKSQEEECDDLNGVISGVTWLLKLL
ncbi:class I SAM-dependent methyltransferase [Clostridium sp. AF15-17LB]|nr:class I SAM-dependent methyltransferase [Clostridium sp. AF15-17LB]